MVSWWWLLVAGGGGLVAGVVVTVLAVNGMVSNAVGRAFGWR
jgi:hypothetical protein